MASIGLGILLVVAPLLGAVVLAWWIGVYALIFGVSFCILAFRLRMRSHDLPPGGLAAAD
jgi:uncharacterized membrane protein HdeD (DUF308 family)